MVFLSLFFLRAFRVVLSGVTGSEQVPSPSTMSTVLELARRGVMNQYPLGSCPRFTRENWPPCPPRLVRLILYMWSAFRVLATNKTPPISGGKYFSFSPFSGPVFAIEFWRRIKHPLSAAKNIFHFLPLAGLSLRSHAGNRSQSRSAASSSHAERVGSPRNPVGMSVAHADHNDPDPFARSHSYQHWPPDPSQWDTAVVQVSGSFNTDNPPLWTPLVTPEARAQAFRNNKGRCLNCHGTDHSFNDAPNLLSMVAAVLTLPRPTR